MFIYILLDPQVTGIQRNTLEYQGQFVNGYKKWFGLYIKVIDNKLYGVL